MKYSLRDLLLVTVIAALAVGWCVDRSRLAGEVRDYEAIEMPNGPGISGPGMPLKEWRQQQQEWKEGEKKFEKEWNEMTEAQREQKSRRIFGPRPTSQTPAPNPPQP
jgi:hypothetical protein